MSQPRDKHLLASARLRLAFAEAQRRLLRKLDDAMSPGGVWPSDEDYRAAILLGLQASIANQLFLKACKTERNEYRIGHIQRLSAKERRWQPSPEAWLRQQDTPGNLESGRIAGTKPGPTETAEADD